MAQSTGIYRELRATGARLITLAFLTGLAGPALAAPKPALDNYDGDTFKATFRLVNVDTPEMKGACPAETQLAQQAKDFTAAWLAKGKVTIQQTGVDRYGRVLARLSRGKEDLGEALIAAGLARPWKGRREKWCP